MISCVIFDLDGTLTKIPSPWRYVHERLGVWENSACGYLDEWLSGKMSYEQFCQRDAQLWNGRSLQEIYAYLDEIELNRHVPAVVQRVVEARIPSIILSSGFKYLIGSETQPIHRGRIRVPRPTRILIFSSATLP